MLHELTTTPPTVQEAVSAFVEAARSASDLRLLREVDETVDALCAARRFHASHAQMGRVVLERIRKAPAEAGDFMDAEFALGDLLERFVDSLRAGVRQMAAHKAAVDGDARLRAHHSDQLHSAYADAMKAISLDAEVTETIADAIVLHDLAAEPRDAPVYRSVAAMHEALAHG